MTKEELFQTELEFIQEQAGPWPNHYIYVKRDRESGKMYQGDHTTIYGLEGGYELYHYDNTEKLLEDGWHVD